MTLLDIMFWCIYKAFHTHSGIASIFPWEPNQVSEGAQTFWWHKAPLPKMDNSSVWSIFLGGAQIHWPKHKVSKKSQTLRAHIKSAIPGFMPVRYTSGLKGPISSMSAHGHARLERALFMPERAQLKPKWTIPGLTQTRPFLDMRAPQEAWEDLF